MMKLSPLLCRSESYAQDARNFEWLLLRILWEM